MQSVIQLEQEVRYFCESLQTAQKFVSPYSHFFLRDVFSKELLQELGALDFALPDLKGISGKREYHNDQRHYFSQENRLKNDAINLVSEVFRHPQVLNKIRASTGARLDGTFVRIEYAQDTDGFWLNPHTDLGVKTLTLIISILDGQDELGTDIYSSETEHFGTCPFQNGAAFLFVPSDHTWHGFEARPIKGVRKSLIMNYVTSDWIARDQLSFSEPIRINRN